MPPSKFDRIEEKVNLLAEHMAAARTDISWLKEEWTRHPPSNGGRKPKVPAWATTAGLFLGSLAAGFFGGMVGKK